VKATTAVILVLSVWLVTAATGLAVEQSSWGKVKQTVAEGDDAWRPASKPSTAVEGLLRYVPTILEVRIAGGNTFVITNEESIWEGAFVGTSTQTGNRVVIHASGQWFYTAISYFEGTVAGKSGSLVMSFVGSRPEATAEWTGEWVILRGTGELAHLRGQGIFWGPGSPGDGEWGDIFYAGTIHFDPN
jgi:hypothetical protein